MIRVSSRAAASLMRMGMLDSPNPGNSITMAPMRANTSMKAAASAGSMEISMRISSIPAPAFASRRGMHFCECLSRKDIRKYVASAVLDLTVAATVREEHVRECQILRTTRIVASTAHDSRRDPHHVTIERVRHEGQRKQQ